MLPDTGIDDVKKQRNAEYAKHINDPVLSSLKMEGILLLLCFELIQCASDSPSPSTSVGKGSQNTSKEWRQ
jgi:hypothetical protein